MWLTRPTMERDTLLMGIALIGIVAAALYRAYLKLKPSLDLALEDGSLSLSEVMDMKDELIDVAGDVGDLIKSLPSASELKKMKKADLLALAEKNNVELSSATLTKAQIIAEMLE